MTAFEKGWIDAESGKTLKQNPFHPQAGEWLAWRNGFRALYASLKLPIPN